MSATLQNASSRSPRVLPETAGRSAKADLRKTESEPIAEQIGACLDDARCELKWTLDELAGKLPPPPKKEKRDPRQVQRWIEGAETCQVHVVFAVKELRAPFVEALARLSDAFEEHRTFKRKIG
jgi:hypothetical protein